MPVADSSPPHEDVFYRETLKALGSELRNIGGEVMRHRRLGEKLVDVVTDLRSGVVELVSTNKETNGLLREIRDALGGDSPRRRTPTVSPVPAVARTRTGG